MKTMEKESVVLLPMSSKKAPHEEGYQRRRSYKARRKISPIGRFRSLNHDMK
jgi:hypothetical protein